MPGFNIANQIPVSGGSPTGLLLDEAAGRLYVLTRFDNAIKIVDTQLKAEIGKAPMYNPEPAHIVLGRRFLYDASFGSSHGDSACFSCHIFGDTDHLAWNLGNPDHPGHISDPECKTKHLTALWFCCHERCDGHAEPARAGQHGAYALAR